MLHALSLNDTELDTIAYPKVTRFVHLCGDNVIFHCKQMKIRKTGFRRQNRNSAQVGIPHDSPSIIGPPRVRRVCVVRGLQHTLSLPSDKACELQYHSTALIVYLRTCLM